MHFLTLHFAGMRCAPVRAFVPMLLAGFISQGCASELGKLNNSTFLSPERQGSAQEPAPGIVSENLPATAFTQPSTRINSTSAVPTTSSRALRDESENLLSSYRYRSNADGRLQKPGVLSDQSPDAVNQKSALPKARERFSIEVASAPIGSVLFALAVDAGLEYQLYGQLSREISISCTDKPLEHILSQLAQQADFVWQIQGDLLTVRAGQSFGQTYPVNYLNINRITQSSVGLATQVGTINASDSSGSSIANSSQTRIENSSEHHFWGSLETDVQSIIKQAANAESTADSRLSINREAGLITLFAMPAVHNSIKKYLELLHANTQRQVLIEATVVEVALSRNFDAGVDWQVIAKGLSGLSAAQVLVGAPAVVAQTIDRITSPSGLVSLTHSGGSTDVSATLSLLEQFGDVRILSRPRIIAMNNQSSVLKVVDNRVYFTVNVQRRQTEDQDEVVTETEIHTVPVGLLMNVTPQISENGSVMLNVRPTLSRILNFVNDPNPELALANVRNGVPEIQVREMESMLQVQSGEVAIIGGLMQETQADNDAQLPGLGRIPVLGHLFSKRARERRQTELLIVLRPTVLNAVGGLK